MSLPQSLVSHYIFYNIGFYKLVRGNLKKFYMQKIPKTFEKYFFYTDLF